MTDEPTGNATAMKHLFNAAYKALRSYQYGNLSPGIAQQTADAMKDYWNNHAPTAGVVERVPHLWEHVLIRHEREVLDTSHLPPEDDGPEGHIGGTS